jgi:hypothetical protein
VSLLLTDRPGLYAHSRQFFYFVIILSIDVSDHLESIRPVLCLSSILGRLMLYGHVESLYYLDDVIFNSNTHRLIDAVRSTSIGHWDTHPDDPRSGAAYYLMVTMVVLFSLVAMTSKSVCKCLVW